ncbi:glycosyltransferase family 1 protein [Rhodovarius crocodyli]|uniref:Glycosyltransferase family 1 protein n=1 Tax=Rhodovarius crocodyli TaxID=1979269 RepID=A0A437MHI4_9PROT|nr:glycosyltransferase family 1 protein [Rhodovarius crocodyli]RVT97103.1 glycosyltransferase family 1 protein [Rhodovarius crocodyli]
MQPLLDLSRLISSTGRAALSGLDRVELAYARHCAAMPEQERCFVARSPWGPFSLLPDRLALPLVAQWEALTRGEAAARPLKALGLAARAWLMSGLGVLPLHRRLRGMPGATLLVVAHQSLAESAPIAALKRRGARFIPIIHDLIPITYPEYSRPRQIALHVRRLANVSALADAVLTDCEAVRADVLGYFGGLGREMPPVVAAPLGFDLPPLRSIPDGPVPERPYFVTLGTIEPRKNHLLLLNLWRDLAERLGPQAPRLVILGRRGWQNETVFRLLDRVPAFPGLVEERRDATDADVAFTLRHARALLFPSFAEGYGIPLIEALSLGTPAICADIPSLREVGKGVPEFISPLDGVGWRDAVLDYSRPDSPARQAQIARIAGFLQPRWDQHFNALQQAVARISTRSSDNTTASVAVQSAGMR